MMQDIDKANYAAYEKIVNTELIQTPNIIKQEYHNLLELLKAGQYYGALLKIKDCFEVNIKFPVITILAYYWQEAIKVNLEVKNINSFADKLFKLPEAIQDILLTCAAKKMSFGEWEAACSAIKCDSLLKRMIKEKKIERIFDLFYSINSNNYEVYCNRRNAENNIEYISAWRNETIGHGALNMNVEDVEKDVYEKLYLLSTLLQRNERFYQQIIITVNEKKEQIVITKQDEKPYEILISPFFDLLNTSNGNGLMFESFSRKKEEALLMNYSSGQKEKSVTLSHYFSAFSDLLRRIPDELTPDYKKNKEKQDKSLRDELLSNIKENSNEKTQDLLLDQKDIDLIHKLKSNEDLIHNNIFCDVFCKIMDLPAKEDGNIYLLCADRGMGKSTFCRVADELDSMKINNDQDDFVKYIKNHQDILIRTYDCNSFYNSKTKTFLSQLMRIFTSELQYTKNCSPSITQRINHSDQLFDAFNTLNKAFCENKSQEDRRLAFWKFLEVALDEWRRLKPNNRRLKKLVLFIDGIDELVEGQDCLNPNDLLLPAVHSFSNSKNIYVMFTCRTRETNSLWGSIVQNFYNTFDAENIRVMKIQDYSSEFIKDVENSFNVSNSKAKDIASYLNYRYSYFAAYKKIYDTIDWNLTEEHNNPFPFYFSYLKRLSKNYLSNVQKIFYLLSVAKDGMTFKELCYMLTGDSNVFPPVDFRIYGMLTDISGFLHYAYDEVRGYIITLSHTEWREHLLKMIETDKGFAKIANSVKEHASLRIQNILNWEFIDSLYNENECYYDGELWLLLHLENLNLTIEPKQIEFILNIVDLLRKDEIYQKYRAIDILNYCENYFEKLNILTFEQIKWKTSIYFKRANLYNEMENINNAIDDCTTFIDKRKLLESEQQYYSDLEPDLSEIEAYEKDGTKKITFVNSSNKIIFLIIETDGLQDGYCLRSYLYANLGKFEQAENDITNAIDVLQHKLKYFGNKFSNQILPNYYFHRGKIRKILGKTVTGNQDIKTAIEKKIPVDLRPYLPFEQLERALMRGELEDSKSLEIAKNDFNIVVKSLEASLQNQSYLNRVDDNLILIEALQGRAKVNIKEAIKKDSNSTCFSKLFSKNKKQKLSLLNNAFNDYNTAIHHLLDLLINHYSGYTKNDLLYFNKKIIELYIEKAEVYNSSNNGDWEIWRKNIRFSLDAYDEALKLFDQLKRTLNKDELKQKMTILTNTAKIYFDLWSEFEEYPNTDSNLFKEAKNKCLSAFKIGIELENLAKRGKILLDSFLIDDIYHLKGEIFQYIDIQQANDVYVKLIKKKKQAWKNSVITEKEMKKEIAGIYLLMASPNIWSNETYDINNVKKYLKNADELLVGLEKEFIALTLTSYSYHVKLNVLENKIEEAFSIGKKGIMLLDDLLQENIKVEPLITEQIILSYQIAIISEYPNSISGADLLHTLLRFLKSRLRNGQLLTKDEFKEIIMAVKKTKSIKQKKN